MLLKELLSLVAFAFNQTVAGFGRESRVLCQVTHYRRLANIAGDAGMRPALNPRIRALYKS